MAAPEYVPRPKIDTSRVYESPPWRPESWWADRPGDFAGPQPSGRRLGNPGPDQGFALRLARQFTDRLQLAEGEREEDATAGCVAVALKRSSMFSRAPMVHDLTVAYTLWGFLGDAPDELIRLRRREFDGVAHHHHYAAQRRIADLVPRATLHLSPDEVTQQLRMDWKALFQVQKRASSTQPTG